MTLKRAYPFSGTPSMWYETKIWSFRLNLRYLNYAQPYITCIVSSLVVPSDVYFFWSDYRWGSKKQMTVAVIWNWTRFLLVYGLHPHHIVGDIPMIFSFLFILHYIRIIFPLTMFQFWRFIPSMFPSTCWFVEWLLDHHIKYPAVKIPKNVKNREKHICRSYPRVFPWVFHIVLFTLG